MKIWKVLPILLLAACTGREVHIDRITLDPPTLTLLAGEDAPVSVRFLSGKKDKVDWFSDDESIATVYSGIVSAESKGKTLVFARTSKSGLLACCEVTVRNPEDQVSGVRISEQTAYMEVEQTLQLSAVVEPETAENKAVTWSSSDNSILTVGSGGIVYALAEGEAVITATTVEGGFTASCTITVGPKYYKLEEVSIPAEINVTVGGTVLLVPEFTPENATNKAVTWFCYDTGIATVDESGLVTGIAPGNTYITVTAEEGGLRDITFVKVTAP